MNRLISEDILQGAYVFVFSPQETVPHCQALRLGRANFHQTTAVRNYATADLMLVTPVSTPHVFFRRLISLHTVLWSEF